ncbi:hypothetical protein PHMEG_0008411 [Phytophthora megakarya]|uniref:C2 domain-containing protein n=1 Tax=Phytophthora megakarya TaxID=4795 RepID=A0A225WIU3_9STRA|nr:hypothetical protein PHMEG_0008411 [Phytophthora megakarya]
MERVHSTSSRGLAGWGNPTIPQSGFTLFLRVHSARNLAAVGRGSYCKLYLGNTEVVNGSTQAGASFSNLLDTSHQSPSQLVQPPTHRVFRTKVVYTDQKSCPEWNEKLELHVINPDIEILTIRVKNQLMLFCPAVGACAIPLANVRLGQPAEQWFPLHKQGKPAGHIRLQLLLKDKDPVMSPPVALDESPMQRLIQQHCQQEQQRRQVQQSEDSIRRQQFQEQERIQAELRMQKQEAQERERATMEAITKMKAFQEQMQREEETQVQAYLQKQMEHEEDWHTDGLVHKMQVVKVEETPERVGKEVCKSNNFFAEDVTASTSRRSSNSTVRKQSFSGSQGGLREEEVHEAVVVTNVEFGEVVSDALPSSDSSSDRSGNQRSRRKDKDRRKQHSRKKSRSTRDNEIRSPPLFPSHPETKMRKEVPRGNLSSAVAQSSSSSEETSTSEEERRRRRRRRKEKKAKRKERRRRRKAKRKARRESDGYESSSSASSSSSSSSSSTSSDDHHRRRKHKKTKERARSYRERKASSIPCAPAPPHSYSYGPDLSDYTKGTNKYNQPPPAYTRSAQSQNDAGLSSGYIETMATQAQKEAKSPPGYIEPLPPQPQQKRSLGEMISTVNDMTSILSNMASVATSVQQLGGGGDGGGGSNVPFAMSDMSQYLGGQDISTLFAGQDISAFAGQDFSCFTGDTTAHGARSIPNAVQRLFSKAYHVLSVHRHGILIIRLDMLLFLKVNRHFWGAVTVSKVVNA